MSMSSDSGPAQIARTGTAGGERFPPRTRVAIGFGSPSDDSGVTRLDLSDILIKHAQATFLMRVAGRSMREAGIDDGDLVLVDRAIAVAHGHVVIAIVDDEFVCRHLHKEGAAVCLRAADATVADIAPRESQEFQIWGVVTCAIKPIPV